MHMSLVHATRHGFASEVGGAVAGKGLGWASKESGVPVIKSVSPALWAHAIEKVYKIVRVSLPELP
jgi:hypothetical protein